MSTLVLPRAYDADLLDPDLKPIDLKARRLLHELPAQADWLDGLDPDLRILDRKARALWEGVKGSVGGVKTFAALEPLYAADVMDYLMRQAIAQVTSGTRPSSPVEGQHIYETDTDATLFYDGSTWKRTGHHIPHSSSFNSPLSAGTHTSTSFGDIPGTSITLSFTKHRADTSIFIIGSVANGYNTSGAFPETTLGCSYNGTDYELASENAAANSRFCLVGISQAITGVAAGTHTAKLRIKEGAGTFTTDAAGHGSILVMESL